MHQFHGPDKVTHDMVTLNHRLAGDVIRYHTWPTLDNQTIAHHTWNLIRIYCQVFGLPRSEMFYFLMFHDTPEIKTGDMPSYTKLQYPEFRELFDKAESVAAAEMNLILPDISEDEFMRFKVCDMLERFEFAFMEYMKGNRLIEPVFATFWKDVDSRNFPPKIRGTIERFVDQISSMTPQGMEAVYEPKG